MKTLEPTRFTPPLMLYNRTAAELMTPNPKSVRQTATVAEAAAFLSLRGISAAPVIDAAGRPVGVVSRTDLLNHRGQRAAYRPGAPDRVGAGSGPDSPADEAAVRDVMTPAVFCVGPHTAAGKVVEKMLGLNVRRVFVVDDEGVLVGVISALASFPASDPPAWTPVTGVGSPHPVTTDEIGQAEGLRVGVDSGSDRGGVSPRPIGSAHFGEEAR